MSNDGMDNQDASEALPGRNGNGSDRDRRVRTLRQRFATISAFHAITFALGLLAAFLLWFDATHGIAMSSWLTGQYLYCLPYFVLLKLVLFRQHRLLRGGWRFSGLPEVARILAASWWFALITFVLMFCFYYMPIWTSTGRIPFLTDYFERFPRAVIVLDFMATVFLVCLARFSYRIYYEELRGPGREQLRRVLIAGAGNAGAAIVREIRRMPVQRYFVIGMVDDEPDKQHIIVNGVPVLGATEDIAAICRDRRIEEIIIAMPSASQKQLRRVIDLCTGTKLKFQSLPGVTDLIDGKVTVSQIRPVDINDLLGRTAAQLDRQSISGLLRDKRVLVTGAGGSIGSEMCRQIANFAPARMIMLDRAENPLFDITNELSANFPAVPLNPHICDVCDSPRVEMIWKEYAPNVVIHAAAHKHVPIMEVDPGEAIKNNVFGAKNVAEASCRHNVDVFVMISTDKAVNPSSVMGATKRIAEIYVQSLNGRAAWATKFMAVRFGNVLGSSGSVVQIFRSQIARGGPVKVTHPEMCRYFMTVSEASQLVLQAAATGQGGQIFLLDMGEPVKIVDLARQMITLSGFRPGEDIDIVFTGVRPGEKLFEELRTTGEDIQPTVHPRVLVWRHKPADPEQIRRAMISLQAVIDSGDRQKTIEALHILVPEYSSQEAPDAGRAG
ncbi:MAG: polysaccharide biosynthesis protein [Planctomycetes bacterium]|nr:polysaccharide biosynthesis protein [Planctomycetota bacterium]